MVRMKWLSLVLGTTLCIILWSSNAAAIGGVAVNTIITINLDKEGNSQITEDYKLNFVWNETLEEFNRLKELGTTDLVIWNNFSESIGVHVLGDRSDISVFTKEILGISHVVIEYSIPGFAVYIGDEGRSIVREINMEQFSFYNDVSNSLILPDKTSITVAVEDTRKNKNQPLSEMIDAIPPGFFMGPYIQNDKIVLLANGPINLNEFKVQYKIEKSISESWGLESMYIFFVKNPIYGIILLVLIVLTIAYRKKVIGVLSESFVGEENIEMPKREL